MLELIQNSSERFVFVYAPNVITTRHSIIRHSIQFTTIRFKSSHSQTFFIIELKNHLNVTDKEKHFLRTAA